MKSVIMRCFVSFISVLLFILPAGAQQFIYVSPSGSDTADGTVSAPLGSISSAIRAASLLPGEDTVFIHLATGTYYLDEPISFTEGDTRPMVLEGDAASMPVISGGFPVGGWEVTPEGWWKTRVPEAVKFGSRFQQFFMNDERAVLARTPDRGLFDVDGLVEETSIVTKPVVFQNNPSTFSYSSMAGYTVHRYATDPEHLADIREYNFDRQDNDIIIMLFQAYFNTRKYVEYASPDSGYVYFAGIPLYSRKNYGQHNRFRLENYKNALTAPREWFLDRDGELSYIPSAGEDPDTAEAFAPGLEKLLVLKGTEERPVSGKVFRNLSFRHTGTTLPRSGRDRDQAASRVEGTVSVDYADQVVFENCEIKHTGNYGITFSHARDCRVSHTFLYDLGAGGIKIDFSKGIVVNDNIIRKGGQEFPAGVGVLIRHSSGNKVLHNDICDLRYSGVSVGWVWGYDPSLSFDNEIAFNHIHHLGWGELDDMGGVYTLGVSPGTVIHDNVIHDIYSHDYGGWGLYTDEGSSEIVMENNLVYACKCSGYHHHYGRDNILRNNIIAWGTWSLLQWSKAEDHRSFTLERNIILSDGFPFLNRTSRWKKADAGFDSNCFWDITEEKPYFDDLTLEEFRQLRDRKTIVADPMFRDPLHGDFTFKSLRIARKIGFKPFDYS